MRSLYWILVGWVACVVGGCGGPEAPPLQRGETAYAATGTIREFPVDGRTVVIRHDEIPGYMPKMTMTFTVRDPRELRALTVGDSVAFRLVATENDHWIDSLRRLDAGPRAAGTSSPTSSGVTAIPPLRIGDPLPPFPSRTKREARVIFHDFAEARSPSRSSSPDVRCPTFVRACRSILRVPEIHC